MARDKDLPRPKPMNCPTCGGKGYVSTGDKRNPTRPCPAGCQGGTIWV